MPLINGDDGPNSIVDTPGDDTINGLLGDDTITVTNGNDSANGGGDFDTLSVSYEASSANISGGLTNFIYGDGSTQNVGFTDFERFVIMTGSGNDNIGTALFSGNDIVSLGAGNDLAATGAGSDSLDGGAGADTMNGGNGNDTYVVDNVGDVVTESSALPAGGIDTVESAITYTLGANVERLTLTGLNAINGTGNNLANTLIGNNAANILNGSFGADTMSGGLGNDTYIIDNAGDVVTESAGTGTDTVQSSLNHILAANFERLVLTGTYNLSGTGNTLANILTGNSGANALDGGAGGDIMAGGLGNDSYFVDNGLDIVVEAAGGGTDTVNASLSHDLEEEVENLILSGSGNFTGNGNSLNNSLTGNSGNNVLNGELGADVMTGGFGDDTYVVDNAGDLITELTGQGTDSVQSSVSFNLSVTVENLQLTGSADINGTGNVFANIMIGNSGANTLNGGAGADVMNGGLGDDIYIVDNSADQVFETSLTGGTDIVQSSASFTLGSNIEQLVLTGANAANGTGNALANVLTGNLANNILDGGFGADTMQGGLGNDTYVIDNAGDVAIEAADEGIDTIRTSLDHTFAAEFENLVLTGTGNLNGTGNDGVNVLTGNSGANQLDGGAGGDIMVGGLGDDSYFVDSGFDIVIEAAGGGIDTVNDSLSHDLEDGVENLILSGSGNITGNGNDLANSLIGNSGNNILNGELGADVMTGGFGDDTYVVDNVGDVITELTGQGTDSVQSSVSFNLSLTVENLLLTGSADINGTGNTFFNIMIGNSAANRLDGGAGFDTMIGGLGNDTYVIDDTGDVVIEAAGEGVDTIRSSLNHTLAAELENLVLTGANAINGTGNALVNSLTGNSAANRLDGGAGADTMNGGLGNDTYVVDNAGDVAIEAAGGGTDTVQTSLNHTLGAEIERLVLTGSGNVNGTGNSLANILTGNSGANVLDGGPGADTMRGGLGNDVYVIDNGLDKVFELAGQGTDKVESAFSYSLGAAEENLTLTGSGNINGFGNLFANILTGNSGANVLNGLAGADTLDGGSGVDQMTGGDGNDLFFVDNVGDQAIETNVLPTGGNDTVQSEVSFTLGANIERLTLVGAALNGTGNGINNVITGNSNNNMLNGEGGADDLDGGLGNDVMRGGAGNDVYRVDSGLDQAIETSAGDGVDRVEASVSFTLGAFVDNLTLLAGATNGAGNAQNNILTGNSAANRLDGAAGADTMNGGLGDDTYVVDQVGDVVTELTGQGTDSVQSAVSFSLAVTVENLSLTGSADIEGTGNVFANVLLGNSGANTLNGGAGVDTMNGGLGNDTYIVDNVADVVLETSAAGGADSVQSSATFTLGSNIESLVLTGLNAINGTGNNLVNTLTGNNAANILNGGVGADTMQGNGGNDTYVIDNVGDVVIEAAGGGTDTIQTSTNHTLAAELENLTLTGTGNVNGTGNVFANSLTGNSGNNILDGGAGADVMNGGLGNDTYFVDNSSDQVFETSLAGGTDIVQSSATFTLGSNIEQLDLTGANAVNGFGNALANTLTGNGAANRLDGGLGADIMKGGLGDDIYVVDQAGDSVSELAGQGTDKVESAVSFTLAAALENLSLTGGSDIEGTGNLFANTMIGNNGANRLDGGGGADTMNGGLGNDTYVVDNGGDVVIESSATGGTDTVESAISFVLGPTLENLTLTGAAANNGTGNGLANTIIGNGAANILNGAAGNDALQGGAADDTLIGSFGVDTLDGSTGADRFTFLDAPAAADADHILSFAVGTDRIVLDDSAFTALPVGVLATGAFAAGTAAADADDRILYDAATGNLFYDSDGTGATAAVLFATLDNHPATLAASDFLVI